MALNLLIEGAIVPFHWFPPHEVGLDSTHWTTGLLADYLARATALAADAETVRISLQAHDDVCKGPTWTLTRKAQEQEGDVGNA
jgi:hypothetical protein